MSVHDDHFIADNMIESGASGFVLKRAAVSELVPAIESIFNGNTYISPSLKSNFYKEEITKEKTL